MKLLFILSVFTMAGIYSPPSFGQEMQNDDLVISLFNNLYSLHFRDAKNDLSKISKGNINPDMKDICIANYHWWYIVTLEENSDHKAKMLDALDSIIERHKHSYQENIDPDAIFALGHAYAYKTRLDMHEGNYLKGVKNLNFAGKYLELILPRAEENIKYKLLAGLYHYIAGSILERYPVFRPLFVFAPDIQTEKGLKYLKDCSLDPHPLISVEASYFIMRVNNQVTENNIQADQIVCMLQKKFPENIYFSSYRVTILADDGRHEEALREYKKLCQQNKSGQISWSQYSFILEKTKKHLRKKKIKF